MVTEASARKGGRKRTKALLRWYYGPKFGSRSTDYVRGHRSAAGQFSDIGPVPACVEARGEHANKTSEEEITNLQS
jgi:hypothetical protein